jgi:hypothetical protein
MPENAAYVPRPRHPYGTDPRVLEESYPTLRDAWEAASRARERLRPVRRDGRWVLVQALPHTGQGA